MEGGGVHHVVVEVQYGYYSVGFIYVIVGMGEIIVEGGGGG